jgi:hypothetical protein
MNAALSGQMYAERIGFRRLPNADFRQANFTMPACAKKVYISSNEVKGLSILNENPYMNEITQFLYVRSVPELKEARLTFFGIFSPFLGQNSPSSQTQENRD